MVIVVVSVVMAVVAVGAVVTTDVVGVLLSVMVTVELRLP